MKLIDIEGFDYDTLLGNWEYLNKEIAMAIDEANLLDDIRNLYIVEAQQKAEANSGIDFWDLYTSVANDIAIKVRQEKRKGVFEAILGTSAFYAYMRDNYSLDFLYNSDMSVNEILFGALSRVLYELILHNAINDYLNTELAKVLYIKQGGDMNNFPYEQVKECLEKHPAQTDFMCIELVEAFKQLFNDMNKRTVTITMELPYNISESDLQEALKKLTDGKIKITY